MGRELASIDFGLIDPGVLLKLILRGKFLDELRHLFFAKEGKPERQVATAYQVPRVKEVPHNYTRRAGL